jgi:hypothetical protein
LTLAGFTFPKSALAEKVLAKGDDWQVYTDGRVAGFFGWVYGDGFPQNTLDPNSPTGERQFPLGGGWKASIDEGPANGIQPDQGKIDSMRIRSGMLGNQLGVGTRVQATPSIMATGYIQIWAWVESNGRRKNEYNYADVRQGYAKLEGPWGSILAGRTRSLFSRAATDIDTMYAHRWGVGFPGASAIDSNGPTNGQIGFGLLGSGFAAGIIYATPVLQGFQLSVAGFDPVQSQGAGNYVRTKYVRPEAELTFERKFGNTGKVFLFADGEYQRVYKDAYCTVDPLTNLPCHQDTAGVVGGGRFELGPVHLGATAFYGKGLGFNYALEVTDVATDQTGIFRRTMGYYFQSQVVLGKFDLFAGWGMSTTFRTWADRYPNAGETPPSVVNYQMGINGGVVYNLTPQIHIDADYFRAQAAWYLGEHQNLNVVNAGLTLNW